MKAGEIDINNLSDFKIKEPFFKKIAKTVLKKEGKSEYGLSVVLVDEKTIKTINKKYRKKDKATDVLSFVYQGDNFPKEELLGEIVICPSQAGNCEGKIVKALIHGILHLLGYDHEKSVKAEKKARNKEEKYHSFFVSLP